MTGEAGSEAGDAAEGTLEEPVGREGVGLHTGEEVTARLLPAEAGDGIRFRRTDLEGSPEVRAAVEAVTSADRGTVLESGGVRVGTPEHLLAALAGSGVDNATVELDAPEPPALDGSAAPWCDAVEEAGVRRQETGAPVFAPEGAFTVEQGESRYTVTPGSRLRVSAQIDFENPAIGRQFASGEVAGDVFCREMAPARTFGLRSWQEELEERGLARGASHENTVVLDEDGLAGDAPDLRFPDEFVRHKIVDLVGDLALLGTRLRAHVMAERPSHAGNVALVRELARRRRAAERDGPVLGVDDILRYLPHRYPFLLVDRIVEFEPGERIVGLKNVTINEPFFQGHFPGHPIMPGVLIVEAMAQVGGLLLMEEFEDPEDRLVFFMSMDDVKFRRPVRPGDQLRFEVEMVHFRGRVCRVNGVARVDGETAAEATLTARVSDR